MVRNSANALAFNIGCDCRIAGKAMHKSPFHGTMAARWFRIGWQHANKYWGADVRGRWFKPLPEVKK